LALIEIVGSSGQSLETVVAAAQHAMQRVLSGKAWVTAKERSFVDGHLTAQAITRTRDGRWRVRRWLILGSLRSILAGQREQLVAGIRRRADSSQGVSAPSVSVTELRPLIFEEVDAVCQLIAGTESPIEPPIEPYITNLKIEFGINAGESPADLATEYRSSDRIREQFARSSGGIVQQNRVLGLIDQAGKFVPLEARAAPLAFAEYALATRRINMYGANPGSHQAWNDFVQGSRQLGRADTVVPGRKRLVKVSKK
jgi:hypothetical protein